MAAPSHNPVTRALNRVGTTLLSPPNGGRGYFRNFGPRDARKIALTFDDGPSEPCTTALLDAMAELDVKGAFFCVGVNAQWHPDTIARAYREGHTIANHSMHHSRKAGLMPGDGRHIDLAAAEIKQIIGREPRLYRPPWGWLTPWDGERLRRRGYTIVGWDVYTLDWQWPEPDGRLVAEHARRDTRPGSILLFHDANAGVKIWDKQETARAIQHLVPALRRDGYEFVTIPELLNVAAYDAPAA
jgi:peptidoglycan/xylan/chitin deacetylase (PgdA/CDA1 family)